jgi:hypothetical protein
MCHPFGGIREPSPSRRTWLKSVAALLGWFSFGSLVKSAAPPLVPLPLIETTEQWRGAVDDWGEWTTTALGEEAGREPRCSTAAVGEEGTATRLWSEGDRPPRLTTMAIGEEGADLPEVTSSGMNEEGGQR